MNVECSVALEKTSLILNGKSSELTENETKTTLTFGLKQTVVPNLGYVRTLEGYARYFKLLN